MSRFIENGKCLYTVVLPRDANQECKFAAQELAYITEKSCGEAIKVITETEKLPENCIHIGATAAAIATAVLPSEFETGSDGYALRKRGNSVFISSFGNEGVIYGVYEFAKKVLGAEYFGPLEWTIPRVENAELFEEDILRRPEFEKRIRSSGDVRMSRRYGLNTGFGMTWVKWDHSFFDLIPKEKYYKDHPEYFSSQGSQLCLTCEGLLEEMKKNVIKELTPDWFEKSDVLAFSIGHEDVNNFCECPRCKKMAKKYGKAGITIRFINKVADTINDFVERNHPGKTVKTVFFGYGPTIDPPVKWNSNDTCTPIDETVVAHKNVAVMLAPLGSNWAYSLLDKENNGRTRASLIGWRETKAEIFMWTYDGVFHTMPLPMDNWEHLKESYQIFKDCNAYYLFDECARGGKQFDVMSYYVRAHLTWNLKYDVDYLIRRFMKGYYKEGADKVYEYYQLFRANTKEQEQRFKKLGKPFALRSFTRTQPYWVSHEMWTKEFLEKGLRLLEEAKGDMVNDDIKSVANRIELEMLSLVCLYLQLYGDELDKQTLEKYIELYERVMYMNHFLNENHRALKTHIYTKKLIEWKSLLWENRNE